MWANHSLFDVCTAGPSILEFLSASSLQASASFQKVSRTEILIFEALEVLRYEISLHLLHLLHLPKLIYLLQKSQVLHKKQKNQGLIYTVLMDRTIIVL